MSRTVLRTLVLTAAALASSTATAQTCSEWRITPASSTVWYKSAVAAAQARLAEMNANPCGAGNPCGVYASGSCSADVNYQKTYTLTTAPTPATFPAYNAAVYKCEWTNLAGTPLSGTFTQAVSSRTDPLGCPECPAAGTMRIVGWAAGSGSVCIGGCSFNAPPNSLVVTAGGAEHPLREAKATGKACAAAEPDIPDAPGDDCMQVAGVGMVCAEPDTNCGLVNGDRVCLGQTQNGCVDYRSGAVACIASTTGGNTPSPPGPDNGTPGQPATPDVQVTVGDTTVNYFVTNQVTNSSTPPTTGPPTGGNPITPGGSDGGTCEGEECGEEGSVSGGLSCAAPPTCSGDALQCAAIDQQWRTRCVDEPTDEQLATAFGPTSGVEPGDDDILIPDQTYALPAAFDATGFLGSGDCPADITLELGAPLPTVTIPISQWCVWLQVFGMAIMVVAYMSGIRIVAGGL